MTTGAASSPTDQFSPSTTKTRSVLFLPASEFPASANTNGVKVETATQQQSEAKQCKDSDDDDRGDVLLVYSILRGYSVSESPAFLRDSSPSNEQR